MKKNLLSAAVAATSVVVASSAVGQAYINDRLTGEALVYPLYSAQNGNDTYIHVVNTTDGYKAVKVRMIEGENSQEVLDFNLYMSPKDHFAFAITADGEGAKLITTDNSCTVPIIPETGTTADGKTIREVAFRNFLYAKDKADDDPDTDADESFDNTGEDREQIGYVEVIEMGQIDPNATAVVDPKTGDGYTKKNVAAAIKHGADGVPADCSIPVAGWSVISGASGKWLTECGAGCLLQGTSEFLPTWNGGGLYGLGTVINVSEGTSFGEDAVAIEQMITAGVAGSALHYEPGSIKPNFNDQSVTSSALVSVPGQGAPMVASFTQAGDQKFETISALFMSDEVMNDYIIDPAIAAQTDWVLTFPTKTFHINSGTATLADGENEIIGTDRLGVYNPFEVIWNGQTACEPSTLAVYDREEAYVPPGGDEPDFSPAPPAQGPADDLLLCYEVTVLQFGDESVTNNDSTVTGVGALLGDYVDGWANLDLGPNAAYASKYVYHTTATGTKKYYDFERTLIADDKAFEGLPVTGFAAIEYTNGNLGGVAANYAFSTEHKTSVTVSGTAR
jgi:hypothetical protein